MFVNIALKHGLVPKSTMPETLSSSATGSMNAALVGRLRVGAKRLRGLAAASTPAADFAKARREIMKDVCNILRLHLGTPPRARRVRLSAPGARGVISIHAPTRARRPRQRRRTSGSFKFQFTRPHCKSRSVYWFQSTRPRGRDGGPSGDIHRHPVSIHAPVRARLSNICSLK